MSDEKWRNNEVQFARLLCELVSNWEDTSSTKQVIRAVADSMDLDIDEVNELFDRAEKVWEAAKDKCEVCGGTGIVEISKSGHTLDPDAREAPCPECRDDDEPPQLDEFDYHNDR